MSVNPRLELDPPPHDGVDFEFCELCQDRYDDWNAGVTWDDGVDLLRRAAQAAGDDGGGFRSRRPVLWAMRVVKMSRWLWRHRLCQEE